MKDEKELYKEFIRAVVNSDTGIVQPQDGWNFIHEHFISKASLKEAIEKLQDDHPLSLDKPQGYDIGFNSACISISSLLSDSPKEQ